MKKKTQRGICHICQKEAELTYEHIPPNKAFNWATAKSIEGDEIMKLITDEKRMPWELEGLKYKQRQRGMGLYSLCEKCNNFTGSSYGPEYIKFAHTINMIFPEIDKKCIENQTNIIGINIEKMNPLLFAKQVLSMFCSICPNITSKDESIIELLLNKDKVGFDSKKYKLSMFLLNQNRIGYNGFHVQYVAGFGARALATIDAYPFGFVLEFNPEENFSTPELDITSFLNDYENREYDMRFGLPILERNNIFSCDYRTKEDIRVCSEDNKKFREVNLDR